MRYIKNIKNKVLYSLYFKNESFSPAEGEEGLLRKEQRQVGTALLKF
jgi:hypothetical protein